MKVKELLKEQKYANYEIYTKNEKNWHSDFIGGNIEGDTTISNDGIDYSNAEVVDYELMNNNRYNSTILANSEIATNDFGWDDDHITLVIQANENE